MNKERIEVPAGIRFLSAWQGFNFNGFPDKCIINKQIPGCGFTEYCIRSFENIILCSPRKMLLKNKFDQHRDEVYLVINELDKDPNIDKDISKDQKDIKKDEQVNNPELEKNKKREIFTRLYSEIEEYKYRRFSQLKPMKILVTYDSYHLVVEILNKIGIFQNFYTVIDEFQSILHDSRFKSSTELNFLNILKQYSHSALFVSATPMLDEYLEMLDDFKNLPYFELDWYTRDHSRVISPNLRPLTMKSVGTKAEEIINTYLQGDFERLVVRRNGIPVEVVSDEAVLYVNSVNHIISIIKKCGLTPEQCNILCADTEDNKRKIKRKLGKGFDIGSVPLEGKKPKMFTFCTRTVYLGADFYSTCARTFIFSDSNSDCLAVDIEEDLPQILGRQRLFENPWKNQANFYYRVTADYKKMSEEQLQDIINTKKKKTSDLLIAYNSAPVEVKESLAETYQKMATAFNYKDDYVAVNKISDNFGNIILGPVINELVLVNEIRAFRIQQIDYADRFVVFSTIHNKLTKDDIINQEAYEFMQKYNDLTEARKKLVLLCESSLNGNLSKEAIQIILDQIPDSDYIKSYYENLGPQRLKALGYKRSNIEKALGIVVFSDELLLDSIYSSFKEGEKYTLANLKQKLSDIYFSISYTASPKAKDIEKYFDTKICQATIEINGERKRANCLELLKSKEQKLRQELKLTE